LHFLGCKINFFSRLAVEKHGGQYYPDVSGSDPPLRFCRYSFPSF
jgi:hypothetical protein